ncbi:hypothetical protein D3C80_1386250 [compost metagenome]
MRWLMATAMGWVLKGSPVPFWGAISSSTGLPSWLNACTSGAFRKASAMASASPVGATGSGAGTGSALSGSATGFCGWLTGLSGSPTGAGVLP